MSFVDTESDWYSASAPAIINAMSYYIVLPYNLAGKCGEADPKIIVIYEAYKKVASKDFLSMILETTAPLKLIRSLIKSMSLK